MKKLLEWVRNKFRSVVEKEETEEEWSDRQW